VGLRRHSFVPLRGILLGLALGLLAASCTATATVRSPISRARLSAGSVVLEQGGTVTVAVPYLPSNFNPSAPTGANAVTQMVMEQVWPQAFVTDSSYNEDLGPGLLLSAELVSVDPQTVVYEINPKAVWSDGVPITAADFRYNWQQHLLHAATSPDPGQLAGYRAISSVTGSDNGRTVTVVFSEGYADWESLFSNLVPAQIGQSVGWADGFSHYSPSVVISGGPFAVTRVVPGRELVLSRNPRYWASPALLAHIIFEVEPSASGTLRGLERGAISLAELAPGGLTTALAARDPGLVESEISLPKSWDLLFNTEAGVLSSLVMRRAIALAIDRPELVADSIELEAPSVPVASNVLFSEGQPGAAADDIGYRTAHLSEALALFSSLGYNLNSAGRLTSALAGPLTLRLAGPAGDLVTDRLEAVFQAEMAQVGIVVQIENEPLARLLSVILPRGDYELGLAPVQGSAFPSYLAALFESPVIEEPAHSAVRLPLAERGGAALGRGAGTTRRSSSPPTSTTASATGTTATTVSGSVPRSTPPVPGTSGAVSANPALPPEERAVEPGALEASAVTRDVEGFSDPAIDSLFTQAFENLAVTPDLQLYREIDRDLWQELAVLPLYQQPAELVAERSLVNLSVSPTLAGPLWDAENWAILENPVPTIPTGS